MPNPFASYIIIKSWTLPLLARRPGETLHKPTGFISEFDCELSINYWAAGDDGYDYELDTVTLDRTRFQDRFIVCKETDPEMWAILERGFKYETATCNDALHERILEKIYEAEAGNDADAAEYAYEEYR